MEPGAIAAGIERLMDEPELRVRLRRNLAQEPLGTEDEVRKFDELAGNAGPRGFAGSGSRTVILAEGSGGR